MTPADESHHAGAESYKKILSYFTPKFLLGMTATPERTDGYNVFSDFDHNIAFEVRLNRALDEDMLCPFHYYGVTDLCTEFDGFILYRKYSKRDVFRILSWDENPNLQNVGGYMIHKDKRDCAIFVNYHKSENISSTTKYEDGFVSPDLFQWMSKI